MIRIIKGTYGHFDGTRVVAKTADDVPFTLETEQEKRLISIGIAEYVEPQPLQEAQEILQDEDFVVTDEYLGNLKMEQLREFAEQFGVKYKVGTKKSEFIAVILDELEGIEQEQPNDEQPNDEQDIDEQDGEEPPMFNAAEAVL